MPLHAVLWDVGGPINTEEEHEANVDAGIRAALAQLDVNVSDKKMQAAARFAVDSYAPDAHKAIIWYLASFDEGIAREAHRLLITSQPDVLPFQMRAGIPELLRHLQRCGIKMGLVANQPASTITVLDNHGVGSYFIGRETSETAGFRKPDVRLFLNACAGIEEHPTACIMVGDRIDNDIAPANSLGMTTILLRTGRHALQRPRSVDDLPDATVTDVAALRSELLSRLAMSG